jgi:hypothetical protein
MGGGAPSLLSPGKTGLLQDGCRVVGFLGDHRVQTPQRDYFSLGAVLLLLESSF